LIEWKKSMSVRKIAKLSGVSVATVSRVLNKQPGVKPETEALVRKCIEEANYVPKMVKKRDAVRISAIMPWETDIDSDWYISQLIQGLGNYAFANNLNLGLFPFNAALAGQIDLVQHLTQNSIDGVVILNATTESTYIAELQRQKIPHMLINEDLDGAANCVVALARAATRQMTEHLLGLGHRQILFIQGSPAISDVRERTAGFLDALTAAGVAAPEQWIVPHGGYQTNMYETGYSLIGEKLAQGLRFSAVIANCDAIALGTIKACKEAGLDVPRDISVVGYDESQFGRYHVPALSTIRQPLKKMSELAMREVHRMIREGYPKHPIRHEVPVELIVRDSTAPTRIQP
jgi:DNA-binding LacI/PurR family transcriptional regulator